MSYRLFIAGSEVALAGTRVARTPCASLDRVRIEYREPSELQFQYFGANMLGAEVMLTVDEVVRFRGTILERRRPRDLGERDTLIAYDLKAKINETMMKDTDIGQPYWWFADQKLAEVINILWESTNGQQVRDSGAWEGSVGLTDDLVPFVAIRNEPFADAVTQIVNALPGFAWLVDPATRRWVFNNVWDAPRYKLEIGRHAAVECDLTESLRDRWTAVRLIGKLDDYYTSVAAPLAYAWPAALQEQWSIDVASAGEAAETPREDGLELVYRCFDFTNLPHPVATDAKVELVQVVETVTPDVFWYQPIRVAAIDWENYKIYSAAPVVRTTPSHKAGWDNCRIPGRAQPPLGVYLVYKSSVVGQEPGFRAPGVTGYAGTAYEVYGIERELVLYEESNSNVTFKRAKRILQTKSDVLIEGSITLSGPVPADLWMLNRRIDITRSGGSSGYENAGAILAALEHDFRGQKTTLHLSTDRSPWAGSVQE